MRFVKEMYENIPSVYLVIEYTEIGLINNADQVRSKMQYKKLVIPMNVELSGDLQVGVSLKHAGLKMLDSNYCIKAGSIVYSYFIEEIRNPINNLDLLVLRYKYTENEQEKTGIAKIPYSSVFYEDDFLSIKYVDKRRFFDEVERIGTHNVITSMYEVETHADPRELLEIYNKYYSTFYDDHVHLTQTFKHQRDPDYQNSVNIFGPDYENYDEKYYCEVIEFYCRCEMLKKRQDIGNLDKIDLETHKRYLDEGVYRKYGIVDANNKYITQTLKSKREK